MEELDPASRMQTSGRIAFTYPNFRAYMLARFLATASSEMQAVAVAWQVYGLTHRPLDLGLVGLAQFLPGICFFWSRARRRTGFRDSASWKSACAGFAGSSALLLALTLCGAWPPSFRSTACCF